MGLAPGQLANRILTVGSTGRLRIVSKHLDDPNAAVITSDRGFTTVTGTFAGVPVSIVAIGMGVAMMDFFVRESMVVLTGPTAICRFGTCGGIADHARAGQISLASKGACLVTRDVDSFFDESNTGGAETHFRVSKVVTPDATLTALVKAEMIEKFGEASILEGVNFTCDTFYGSQGRLSDNFDDHNQNLIEHFKTINPDISTMEMETLQLFHLARCSKTPLHAAAAAIVMTKRVLKDRITEEQLHEIESEGGRAVLSALSKMQL